MGASENMYYSRASYHPVGINKDRFPTRDSRPDPNVSFIQRFHCTTRDSRPDPTVSFIRFHCTTRDVYSRPDHNMSFHTIFNITFYSAILAD